MGQAHFPDVNVLLPPS